MTRILDSDDMVFHMLVAGGTGSGKTNALLHMLDLLFNKKVEGRVPPSLFLFDPAGDASIDLLRAIPESERSRVVILDPQYVTFGFNLLSLPENLDPADRPEILQAQVDEFSALLADVFNTDATNAPRLMWIFKGALYYLYSFPEDPTLWELYNIMLRFTKRNAREIEDLLRSRNVNDEIIQGTIEAISKLPPDAYAPVLNRISNFVLPSTSITFRTFCSRKSTVDLEKLMEPGRLTIFRIPSSLPGEFRKLFAASVVMKLYFASLKRAKRLERSGQPPTARSPVILAADEFRDIAQMKILRTILSQSRKYGLYLWMVVQTLSEVPDELMGSIEANVGPVLAFRGSPDDARRLAKLLHPQRAETVEKLIPGLEDYAAIVRKRPVGGKPVEPPVQGHLPQAARAGVRLRGGPGLHQEGHGEEVRRRSRGQEPAVRGGRGEGQEGQGRVLPRDPALLDPVAIPALPRRGDGFQGPEQDLRGQVRLAGHGPADRPEQARRERQGGREARSGRSALRGPRPGDEAAQGTRSPRPTTRGTRPATSSIRSRRQPMTSSSSSTSRRRTGPEGPSTH